MGPNALPDFDLDDADHALSGVAKNDGINVIDTRSALNDAGLLAEEELAEFPVTPEGDATPQNQ